MHLSVSKNVFAYKVKDDICLKKHVNILVPSQENSKKYS